MNVRAILSQLLRAAFLVALALAFLPRGVKAASIDIGADRQLMIDDTLVDLSLSRNATRTVNPPTSIHRVLAPDQPWEALGFIHTAGSGSVKVALLQPDGTPCPEFATSDCELISTDEIDYEVRWKTGPDLSALAGKSVRVQLEMRNARLFALQFGEAKE